MSQQIVKNGRTFNSMQEYITFLETQHEQYAAKLAATNNAGTVTFKIGEESGAISTYGIQNQRPVSLYSSQLVRLIEACIGKPMEETTPLAKFISANLNLLALRDDTPADQNSKASARKSAVDVMLKDNPKGPWQGIVAPNKQARGLSKNSAPATTQFGK